MEKVPDRRYQTALEMTGDIDRFLSGEPIEAKPASVLYYAGRRLRKHWKALTIYTIVLYATIHGIILYLNSRPSALHLSVETPGAMVAVDHSALSDSEMQSGLSLKAGAHEILVENEPLYDPKQISFNTKPGESRTMSVALLRRKGSLAITTDPPDIGVTVTDGTVLTVRSQGQLPGSDAGGERRHASNEHNAVHPTIDHVVGSADEWKRHVRAGGRRSRW
jgi:hypothetical protein